MSIEQIPHAAQIVQLPKFAVPYKCKMNKQKEPNHASALCFAWGYTEYRIMPRAAEMRIISMGDGFFFRIFLKTKATAIRRARIISPRRSGVKLPQTVVTLSRVLSAIVIAVARMRATTQGRTPRKKD